ncbi:MAG: hypothetical protein OXG70_08160 [Cyanobacteria bacterium MAG IRC1_bin_28]|nr:hypothetical protein [Cyanobacteria bacterium MAG IRC1_bin_28]
MSTLSFTPVTITICAVAQLPDVPDVKVNVWVAPAVSPSVLTVTPVPAVTVTVTSLVGSVASTTVYIPVPPSSATDSVSGVRVTGRRLSQSP